MAESMYSLATYVGDMLVMEQRMRAPIGSQCTDREFDRFSGLEPLLERISGLCDGHITALHEALKSLGVREYSSVKSVGSNIEGLFATAIDMLPESKVEKELRDDYAALALCTFAYSILLTAAKTHGNGPIAALAQQHLQDYAQAVMQISDLVPVIVVEELRANGIDAPDVAVEQSRSALHAAWRSGPQTTTGTIESEAALNQSVSRSTYPTV
jgi:hypothetical protein